jgi:hypothetical protein
MNNIRSYCAVDAFLRIKYITSHHHHRRGTPGKIHHQGQRELWWMADPAPTNTNHFQYIITMLWSLELEEILDSQIAQSRTNHLFNSSGKENKRNQYISTVTSPPNCNKYDMFQNIDISIILMRCHGCTLNTFLPLIRNWWKKTKCH